MVYISNTFPWYLYTHCISIWARCLLWTSFRQIMETMKNFGLKTSIKGIPRALKSQSTSMRVLWSVSVVLFFGMACFQSYLLTYDYLEFAVTTMFSEYRVDLLGDTERRIELPDISICNTNPFGSNAGVVTNIPTLKEYHDRVLNITSCNTCSSSQNRKLKQAQEMFLTPEAYGEFIGVDHIKQVGHSLQSLLVDCKLIVMEGRILKHIPCFPGVKVTDRYDVKYYNCYTLQVPKPSLPGHLYFGLAFVLHLDNFYQDRVKYLDKANIRNRMTGIEMNFHAPNRPLLLDFQSIFLPPGFLADIKVGFERREHMSFPFGTCHMDKVFYNTTDFCYAGCIQSHVTDTCGCLDQNPYTDMNKIRKNITKCLDIDQDDKILVQTAECVIRERNVAMTPCFSRCTDPCQKLRYTTQVGSSCKS